jgi:hypothetical protein
MDERTAMVPVATAETAEEIMLVAELVSAAGIPEYTFGGTKGGQWTVVPRGQLPRAREVLRKDERTRRLLVTDEQVEEFLDHYVRQRPTPASSERR